MNDSSQHELDDELLSAYLDDELSADERALVEARLAADPAAQQSFDQLRHISHSVRSLPRETAPPDLQDAVLSRIEAVKANEASPAPTISIGRTRRGWIWASLAVAAALLIMVVQSDETDNKRAPAVAMKERASTETSERSAEAPPQWRARGNIAENEPQLSNDVQDRAAAPAAREPMTRDFNDSLAESAPAPAESTPATSFGTEAVPTDGTLADSTMREGLSRRGLSGSSAAVTDAETPADQPAEHEVVVVHVLAKPAAIKNKAFDALLASNGVVVAPTDGAEKLSVRFKELPQERGVASGRAVGEDQQLTDEPSSSLEEQSQSRDEKSKEQPEEVDVVLVEAPTTTIFSCMEDLNRDSDNYLGVVVDTPTETDDLAKIKTPQAKKLASDLGIYNRGAVPLDAKDKFEGDRAYFGYAKVLDESAVADSNFGRGGGLGGVQQEGRKSFALGDKMERGRARRLQAQAAPNGQGLAFSGGKFQAADTPTSASTATEAEQPKSRAMIRELKERSGPADEPMQVLFVLRAGDEPTPSATATDRAE